MLSKMATAREGAAQQSRARFQACFQGRLPVRISVLHVSEEVQTLHQVDAARSSRADGVFLVNRGIGHQKLLRIARQAASIHPGYFIGVKCRDLRPQDVFCRLPQGVLGVWSDQPDAQNANEIANALHQLRHTCGWKGLYFEQCPLEPAVAPPRSFRTSLPPREYRDVFVVGDPAAPKPPSLDAVRRLKGTLGEHPLALSTDRPRSTFGRCRSAIDVFLVTQNRE